MAVNWNDVEKSAVEAITKLLQEKGIATAKEAGRGAIFLVRAEKAIVENERTMSANTKEVLARQQKLAFDAYVRGYQGVTKLVAAQALEAAIKAIVDIAGKAFIAA
jgi:hypothetical protein